jgi:hypothetical protein
MDILGIRMDDIVGAMNYHVIIETRAIREFDKTVGSWRAKKFSLEEIARAARVCRVRRVIQPYLEMLS